MPYPATARPDGAPILAASPPTFPRNGGRDPRRSAGNPPIHSRIGGKTSRPINALTDSQTESPVALAPPLHFSPSRRWGGRRIRASRCRRAVVEPMKPGGRRPRGSLGPAMDAGPCSPRASCAGPLGATPCKSPPGRLRKEAARVSARPDNGRRPAGAWKTTTRGGLSRRNGNSTTAPGEPGRPAPSPNFPAAMPESANSCPDSGPPPATVRHAPRMAKQTCGKSMPWSTSAPP